MRHNNIGQRERLKRCMLCTSLFAPAAVAFSWRTSKLTSEALQHFCVVSVHPAMADAANDAPKAKGRGFFEVGMFKKRRVTDAVRDRRMGSEFVVQVRHVTPRSSRFV